MGQIIAGGIALVELALANQACAQFTGDYQTNIIDGTTVNWPGYYHVGSNYVSDALFILDAGFLSSTGATLGFRTNANSNLAVVSGSGSVWTNYSGDFDVGFNGCSNRLVISNGGRVLVASLNTVVGSRGSLNGATAFYNSALVTDTGSVWNCSGGLFIGDGGAYCSLVISNGGAVFNTHADVGGSLGGETNIAIVTGSGSI